MLMGLAITLIISFLFLFLLFYVLKLTKRYADGGVKESVVLYNFFHPKKLQAIITKGPLLVIIFYIALSLFSQIKTKGKATPYLLLLFIFGILAMAWIIIQLPIAITMRLKMKKEDYIIHIFLDIIRTILFLLIVLAIISYITSVC